MCNLYSQMKGQEAIRRLTRVMRDSAGDLRPYPAIFPDVMAPVVRNAPDSLRELVLLRWGMPSPLAFVRGIDQGVTNIRNLTSLYWRRWIGVQNRCVVPATSFCELSDRLDPATSKKVWTWFALGDDRPLFFFAGVWTTWQGVRGTKANPIEGPHELFGFLTTEPNETVRAVHEKAMPVILRTAEEIDLWMRAPSWEALALQKPLPNDALKIVASGKQEDSG